MLAAGLEPATELDSQVTIITQVLFFRTPTCAAVLHGMG
jgi:hypothetical protein